MRTVSEGLNQYASAKQSTVSTGAHTVPQYPTQSRQLADRSLSA